MKRTISIFFLLILALFAYAQPSADKLIKQGISFHDKGKYMEAISCYQQALKVNPSSMSAVYEMSLSYLKMKDYDNAIIHSTQVINIGFRPLLVDAYVVKGTSLAAQNKLDNAIELFNQAIQKCGDEYLLHYNLGLSYYNKGSTNLAIIHLKKAIEEDKTQAGTFLLYAYALRDAGDWIQSIYAYHFFLLLEPNTKRSSEAFKEVYELLSNTLESNDKKLTPTNGLDRKEIYNKIQALKSKSTDLSSQYKFFEQASMELFSLVNEEALKSEKEELFWTFFVPVFTEILESKHFHAYCRYVSVGYFPESYKWWETNKNEVDEFIQWFEHGEDPNAEPASEEDAYFEGDEEEEINSDATQQHK